MSKVICSVCGSEDVQAQVWVYLNQNFRPTTDFVDEMIEEPFRCWCGGCEEFDAKLIVVDDDYVHVPTPPKEKIEPETFHCELCGSTKVMSQAWVRPNENDKPVADGVKDEEGYCEECNRNITLVTRSELMCDVNGWWTGIPLTDVEAISGLKVSDYPTENGSLAFTEASDLVWYDKPEKERIEIWRKYREQEDSETKNYTCPQCYNETLKYAMIDIDGTNLEEGYQCSNCGADFIGLDNEQVLEINEELQNNG